MSPWRCSAMPLPVPRYAPFHAVPIRSGRASDRHGRSDEVAPPWSGLLSSLLVFRFSAGRGASELAPARVSGTAGCGGCRCCAKRSPRQSRRQAPCSCEAGRSADNPRLTLRSSTTSRKPATCCARSSVGTTTTAKQYGEHASTRLRSGWHHVRQPHAPARKSRLAIRDRTLHTGQQVADGSTLSRAS